MIDEPNGNGTDAVPENRTRQARFPERGCCRLVGFTTTAYSLRVHPNTGGTTSHSTKPASVQVAGYLPEDGGTNGSPLDETTK